MPVKHKLPCRSVDPEIFFPVGTGAPALMQAELAKTYCHRCPIEQVCLEYALSHTIMDGVWGGTTEDERRAMIRRGALRRIHVVHPAPLVGELASA